MATEKGEGNRRSVQLMRASCRRGSEGITSCYNGRKCVTDERVHGTEKNGRERETRGDGRSEPIRGGEKNPALAAGGSVAHKQTNKQPTEQDPRLPPSTVTGLNTFDPASPAEGKVSHCSATTAAATKEKVFVRNIQLFSSSCECGGGGARTMAQFIAVRQQGCRGNLWAAAV